MKTENEMMTKEQENMQQNKKARGTFIAIMCCACLLGGFLGGFGTWLQRGYDKGEAAAWLGERIGTIAGNGLPVLMVIASAIAFGYMAWALKKSKEEWKQAQNYDDEAFDVDRDELLNKLLSTDIDTIVNVGASIEGCRKTLNLAKQYKNIYAAIGVHPDDYDKLNEDIISWLKEEALSNPKVVAIGEIGLDYYYDEPERAVQLKWFERQLQMAVEVNKPVIIHSREACADTINILKNGNADKTGGIIHCYSYTKESVKIFYDMNFYFGIGGVLTFKNARKLVEAAEVIPMERILLETDCPYLAPVPNRGKRNDSSNIRYVIEKLAEIKKMSYDEIVDITNNNARRLFFKEA